MNPTIIYSYAKTKLSTLQGIADLTDEYGWKVTTYEAKAVLHNRFFCILFTKENTSSIPEFPNRVKGASLTDINIDDHKVKRLLLLLNISKSQGPDGLHPRVLKKLAEDLSEPLAKIFRLSLAEGTLPEQWKTANVTSLFKRVTKANQITIDL